MLKANVRKFQFIEGKNAERRVAKVLNEEEVRSHDNDDDDDDYDDDDDDDDDDRNLPKPCCKRAMYTAPH